MVVIDFHSKTNFKHKPHPKAVLSEYFPMFLLPLSLDKEVHVSYKLFAF